MGYSTFRTSGAMVLSFVCISSGSISKSKVPLGKITLLGIFKKENGHYNVRKATRTRLGSPERALIPINHCAANV